MSGTGIGDKSCPTMDENRLQAKVSGFVPGVDMVDGKCDIETAHYFIQIYADGDVYTVRRTAISFVDLDRDLQKRFPKLGLMELPFFEIEGSSALRKPRKIDAFLKKAKSRSDILLGVDELMRMQPSLTQWLSSLIAIEPVLACDEVASFLTDSSPMDQAGEEKDEEGKKSRTAHEQNVKTALERFGKGRSKTLEQVLTENTAVVRQKIQPSHSHTVTLNADDAGHVLVWCFTTLPGKSGPAKDIAFSLNFNGTIIKPYERYSKAPTELIKGCWQCPAAGVATFTWHNDYSKWHAKYVALKAVVLAKQQFLDAQLKLKKTAEERQERDERREALSRAMNSTQDASSLDLFGDFPDRSSSFVTRPSLAEIEKEHEARPAMLKGANAEETAGLRKDVARLEAAVAELTQENATQREQVDNLTLAGRAAVGSLEASLEADLANCERTCVKLGQQLATLTKDHNKEKEERENLKQKYADLVKRFSDRDDAVEMIQARRAALEAQLSTLKEEKKVLKVVAKQYKEEASTYAHELAMIRQHQASMKEKELPLSQDSLAQSSLDVFAKPAPPPQDSPPPNLSEEEIERLWSARVSSFYAVYCPSKVGIGCRDTAAKFKGRESDLFAALYHKYSVPESEQLFHTSLPKDWLNFR